jgi:ABC-type branched-subunit amino acid transport system substrate-binding protein
LPSPVPLAARSRFGAGFLLALLLGVSACAPQPRPQPRIGMAPPVQQAAPQAPVSRAAMLVPLTGPQAPLGQTLLNAGIMGLFDEASTGVEIAPADTGGTPSGAAAAARQAIAGGARILIGPLTSAETAAVVPVARAAGVPMLAFTNDASRAAENAWVLGVTPQQQVRRVVAAAARDGRQRFALAAPNNEFGRALAEGLRSATADLGLAAPIIALHPSNADPAQAAAGARLAAPQADALLIGEAGDRARRFAAAFLAEAQGSPPRLLGTALWMEETGPRGDELAGAWFAGPDAGARTAFEGRYRSAFGSTPPRTAATAYDAASLAVRSLRTNQPVATLTILRSFAGADGPLRLVAEGQTLRGLALYAVEPAGEPTLIEAATDPGGPAS